MRQVAIVGVSHIPVGEHWASSLRMLASEVVHDVLKNSGRFAKAPMISDLVSLFDSAPDRQDPLFFASVQCSADRALSQAGLKHTDIDLFELHGEQVQMRLHSTETCQSAIQWFRISAEWYLLQSLTS